MSKTPLVVLLIESFSSHGRNVLAGVSHYARMNGPWSFFVPPRPVMELSQADAQSAKGTRSAHSRMNDGQGLFPNMKEWKPSGIIARIESRAVAEAITAAKVPTVGLDVPTEMLRQLRKKIQIHEMHPDPRTSVRMAGEHLLERGFKFFAFVGLRGFNYSEEREQGFLQFISGERGHPCAVFNLVQITRPAHYGKDQRELGDWLRKQPKPLGVACCDDESGREVLNAALMAGIAVPDEMAVIGMDNDELLCNLCNPPLSSVIPNSCRAGYEAAALLDRMMAGGKLSPQSTLIQPTGIATRQSTDVVAVDDRKVAAAVRFIRENSHKNITVSDVIKAVPMSRTLLDLRFKQYLGHTPHEQILRVKIERVKLMLTTTDLTLPNIAERVGFEHVEYMSVAFKRTVGMPPSTYRKRNAAFSTINSEIRKIDVGKIENAEPPKD